MNADRFGFFREQQGLRIKKSGIDADGGIIPFGKGAGGLPFDGRAAVFEHKRFGNGNTERGIG